jgi:hypothetical protein
MDVHSKPLGICLYLKNGSESRFAMDDAAAATELLATIQPGHLFSRPELIIGGSYSLTMIRTDSVDCIEFVTAGYPGWPFAPKVKDALQITPAEFQSMISGGPAERLRTADASAEGVQFDACAELVLGSGKRLYHALNMIGDPQTPRRPRPVAEPHFQPRRVRGAPARRRRGDHQPGACDSGHAFPRSRRDAA